MLSSRNLNTDQSQMNQGHIGSRHNLETPAWPILVNGIFSGRERNRRCLSGKRDQISILSQPALDNHFGNPTYLQRAISGLDQFYQGPAACYVDLIRAKDYLTYTFPTGCLLRSVKVILLSILSEQNINCGSANHFRDECVAVT